jgi:hypothetical protein
MRCGFFRDGRHGMNKRKPWMAHLGIPALLPDDPNGPDATSGGGGQPVPDPAPQPAPDLGDPGKKALAEERAAKKAAEKRATEAEARLKERDEADLSEQQRAVKRAEEAEQRANAAESRALRLEVVTETGLPAAMAGRLQGATKDELLADAESLKALLAPNGTSGDGGTPPPANGANRLPRPDPSQGGGKPSDGKSIQAGADLFAERKQKQATPFTT